MAYHDHEWGKPLHDDRALFELLTLEGAQAGLSWITILRRRETYRRAFAAFEVAQVAAFDQADVERLLADDGIIRNRQKVTSTVDNARCVVEVQAEFGSFDSFVWPFVGGQPRVNTVRSLSDIPAKTAESVSLSNALRKRGFRFVGPTICYASCRPLGS